MSDRWYERLLREHAELQERTTKLRLFLGGGALGITHEQTELLEIQLPVMEAYLKILAKRIDLGM